MKALITVSIILMSVAGFSQSAADTTEYENYTAYVKTDSELLEERISQKRWESKRKSNKRTLQGLASVCFSLGLIRLNAWLIEKEI